MSLFQSEQAQLVQQIPSAQLRVNLPTAFGNFQLQLMMHPEQPFFPHCILHTANPDKANQYHHTLDPKNPQTWPLVRIHSECLTGDIFASQRCECGPQLHASLEQIQHEPTFGFLFYLRQEGRGIGLEQKMRAYLLQEQGFDTAQANLALNEPLDKRDYGMVATWLVQQGITHVRLMSNNPLKIQALENQGITVQRVPLIIPSNPHNQKYLHTKAHYFGHFLSN